MEASKTLNALGTLTLAAAALVTHTPAQVSIADRLQAIEAAQSRIITAKRKGKDDEIEKDAAIIVANLSALIEG